MTEKEVLLELVRNIPWAVAAGYLGREMMRRWDEDRLELRELVRGLGREVEEIKERLSRAGH
ncbi:MAG: hypothetical protein K6U09_12600 [Acidobacteriia bacterium]|nr:hypothetical protein [Terriglobia bacterium]